MVTALGCLRQGKLFLSQARERCKFMIATSIDTAQQDDTLSIIKPTKAGSRERKMASLPWKDKKFENLKENLTKNGDFLVGHLTVYKQTNKQTSKQINKQINLLELCF